MQISIMGSIGPQLLARNYCRYHRSDHDGCSSLDLRALWLSQTIGLSDLFLFFIYAEIIGMVGAFYASRRIPVTLPIIIAITALCRTIIGQGKEVNRLWLSRQLERF